MRKEGLENMTLTEYIEGQGKSAGRSCVNGWWIGVERGGLKKGQQLLRATKDRMLWRAIIAHVFSLSLSLSISLDLVQTLNR